MWISIDLLKLLDIAILHYEVTGTMNSLTTDVSPFIIKNLKYMRGMTKSMFLN